MQTKPIENDLQPEELVKTNHSTSSSYPKLLTLSTGERLQYHQVELVLRYHVPNKFKPESYAHHLLFMFCLFRDECELKLGQPPSYSSKLNEPGVLDMVSYNKSLVESYSDLIDAAF